MRARWGFTAGAWALATAAATVVSWLGVQLVTSAVTTAPAPVLPASRIAAVVGAPPGTRSPLVGPTSTSTTVPPVTTPRSRVTGTPPTSTVPPSTAPVPRPTTPSRVQPLTTVPSQRDQTPTTVVPPVTPPSVSTSSRTFTSAGGEATVSCESSTPSLLSAVPNNGYMAATPERYGNAVQEYFDGPNIYEVEASCSNGQVTGGVFGPYGGGGGSNPPGGGGGHHGGGGGGGGYGPASSSAAPPAP